MRILSLFILLFLSSCTLGENPDKAKFEEDHKDIIDTAGEEALLEKVKLENSEGISLPEETMPPSLSPSPLLPEEQTPPQNPSPSPSKPPEEEEGDTQPQTSQAPSPGEESATPSLQPSSLKTFRIAGENNGYQCTMTCTAPQE